MTRRSIPLTTLGAAVFAALALQPPGFAFATEPESNPDGPRSVRTSREILLSEELVPDTDHSWLSSNFHLQPNSGFGYSRVLKLSEKPLVFRVRGPVLRKQKALGLRFAIDF